MDCKLQFTGENNMKHIVHLMDKYEDVAEALMNALFIVATTGLILGLAPIIMLLQWSGI